MARAKAQPKAGYRFEDLPNEWFGVSEFAEFHGVSKSTAKKILYEFCKVGNVVKIQVKTKFGQMRNCYLPTETYWETYGKVLSFANKVYLENRYGWDVSEVDVMEGVLM
jgi:predicted transcriptional regulator